MASVRSYWLLVLAAIVALLSVCGIVSEVVESIANKPYVIGRVISSVSCTRHSSSGGHRRISTTVKGRTYTYWYRVCGEDYSGEQWIADSEIDELLFDKNKVRVYYSENQPSTSFLEPKRIDGGFVFSCLIFLTLSVFVLVPRLKRLQKFCFPATTYWKLNVFDYGLGKVRSLGFIGHAGFLGETKEIEMRPWLKTYAVGDRFEIAVSRKTPNILVMKRTASAVVLFLYRKRKLFESKGVYCHIQYHGIAQCLEEFGEGRGIHDLCMNATSDAEAHDENGYVKVSIDKHHQLNIGNAIFAIDVEEGFLKGFSDKIEDPDSSGMTL